MSPIRRRRAAIATAVCILGSGIAAAQAVSQAPGPPENPGGDPGRPPVSQTPIVTVTSPVPSTTTTASSLTVAGTAIGGLPITGVTVNGQVATLSPSGGFTATVGLSLGTNHLSIVAVDVASRTGTATVYVLRTVPPPIQTPPTTTPQPGRPLPTPTCRVPRLHGKTVANARRALRGAGCRLGSITRARSSAVRRGRVLTQGVKAGRVVPAHTTVRIRIGAGARSS